MKALHAWLTSVTLEDSKCRQMKNVVHLSSSCVSDTIEALWNSGAGAIL